MISFDRVVWQVEKSPDVGKVVERQVEEIIITILLLLLLLLILIIIVSIIIREKQVEETRSGEAEEGRRRGVARYHRH